MLEHISSCRLDPDGLRLQRDRYARLGTAVVEFERVPGRLTVRFGPSLDPALLEDAIAVESRCCPFFNFDYDAVEQVLGVGVEEDQRSALDALAYAFGGDRFGSEPAATSAGRRPNPA